MNRYFTYCLNHRQAREKPAGQPLTAVDWVPFGNIGIQPGDEVYSVKARHHLEIGGRSRRRDLDAAWEQKQPRLVAHGERGCYLCVSEFETFTGRLAFKQ
jgi:hypothetical protein